MLNGISGVSATSPIFASGQSDGSSSEAVASSGYSPADGAADRTASGPNNTDMMRMPHKQAGAMSDVQQGEDNQELKSLLGDLINLLMQLLEQLKGSEGQGAVTPDGGGVLPENGTSGSAGGSNIPKPTEHIQTIELGGKQVTIGGDGTASAAEVQETADTMKRMYQTSPTFRGQIDSNQNASLEVSVGRRSDNTSWGNSDGRVFLNINNVSPTSNDTFEALVSHEVAHTQGHDHGSEMDSLEERVAAEA